MKLACECGRLWVERQRGPHPMVSFTPDSGRPERVLASRFGSPLGERATDP